MISITLTVFEAEILARLCELAAVLDDKVVIGIALRIRTALQAEESADGWHSVVLR